MTACDEIMTSQNTYVHMEVSESNGYRNHPTFAFDLVVVPELLVHLLPNGVQIPPPHYLPNRIVWRGGNSGRRSRNKFPSAGTTRRMLILECYIVKELLHCDGLTLLTDHRYSRPNDINWLIRLQKKR